MYRTIFRITAGIVLATFQVSIAFAQNCDLIGQPVTLTAAGTSTPMNGVVQSGSIEFNSVPNDGRFSVDVEGTTIRMLNNTAAQTIIFNSGAAPYTITFGQLQATIVGVSVATSGVTGLAANAVTFTSNSVTIAPANSSWNGGNNIVITLQLACPTCDSLIGQLVELTAAGTPTPMNGVVQSGSIEFNSVPNDGRFSVDVEGTTIRMLNNTAAQTIIFNSGAAPYTITFGQLQATIVGVSVATSGVTGLAANAVTFTSNSVTIAPANSRWNGGNNIVITLQTVCPPSSGSIFRNGFEASP